MIKLSGAVRLVAEAAPYEHMARRFRPGGNTFGLTDAIVWLLLLAGVVVLVWFLQNLVTRISNTKKHSLNGLFLDLCAAHGIGWYGRRLLQRLAVVHSLPHPVHLFLREECLRPQALTAEQASLQNDISILHATLFGENATADKGQ